MKKSRKLDLPRLLAKIARSAGVILGRRPLWIRSSYAPQYAGQLVFSWKSFVPPTAYARKKHIESV
jgi:hypothetical protein